LSDDSPNNLRKVMYTPHRRNYESYWEPGIQ
jgi:hypothetical protein